LGIKYPLKLFLALGTARYWLINGFVSEMLSMWIEQDHKMKPFICAKDGRQHLIETAVLYLDRVEKE
jgi:hypothetical protein